MQNVSIWNCVGNTSHHTNILKMSTKIYWPPNVQKHVIMKIILFLLNGLQNCLALLWTQWAQSPLIWSKSRGNVLHILFSRLRSSHHTKGVHYNRYSLVPRNLVFPKIWLVKTMFPSILTKLITVMHYNLLKFWSIIASKYSMRSFFIVAGTVGFGWHSSLSFTLHLSYLTYLYFSKNNTFTVPGILKL